MNKHILMVIDNQLNPDKYTQEQLEDNAVVARDAAYTAACAVDAAYAAVDAYVANVANAAVDAYVAYTHAKARTTTNYWLDRYFKHTGENKQDYIDAVNKDNKQ